MWDFIREGQQDLESEHSLETAHAAAEMIKSRPASNAGDTSFDFGQATQPEQLVGAIASGLGDWSDDAPF